MTDPHDNKVHGRPRTTIRFQLLVVVNSVLVFFVAFFLVMDYRRDLAGRLEEKHIALEEEANILLPAVIQLHHHGTAAVQQYIDVVCGRMQMETSPGHHIAVQIPDAMLQATSHGRASPEMLTALENAADSSNHRATFGNTDLIVGVVGNDNFTIYVAETLANVKRAVRTAFTRRLAGVVVVLLVAAVIVNLVLLRAVTNPIQRLVTTVQQIGRGQLGIQSESFRSTELDYLASEITGMSMSLASADRDRKSQMDRACDIQQHLLPKEIPTPGLRVAYLFRPAEEIGGDYYDILPLKDGSWLICVADVTGHGVPAAMSAAMLKTLLLQAVETHTSPVELLDVVNRRFTAVSLLDDFVSMILLRVEPQAGRFQYASAGHEPGWLISSNKNHRELSSTGLLLGIDEQATWEEVTIETTIGDRLIILTDGVTEMFDQQGKLFGRKRLFRLLTECQELTIDQTAERIDEALAAYRGEARQHDDVTAVLVELTLDAP